MPVRAEPGLKGGFSPHPLVPVSEPALKGSYETGYKNERQVRKFTGVDELACSLYRQASIALGGGIGAVFTRLI